MFTDSELREMAASTRVSEHVLRDASAAAPRGLAASWGDTVYRFGEAVGQTFDPGQAQTLDVAVNPGLGAASHETAAGEVFYRDRTKSVTSARYAELPERAARVLMPGLTVYDGRVMALSTPSRRRSS